MSNTLKRHSSNPNIMTFSKLSNYPIPTHQSRYSQINQNQNIYSPNKKIYHPNYYYGSKDVQKAQYDYKKTKYPGDQRFQTYQLQNITNKYQNQTQYPCYPTFVKQNIIQAKNHQNQQNFLRQKANVIKPRLSHNVYLTKQNPQQNNKHQQQRKNYILPSSQKNYFPPNPKDFEFSDKQRNQITQSFELRKIQNEYNRNYQNSSCTGNSQIGQIQQYSQYSRINFDEKQRMKKFQYSNNILEGFTFKDKALRDNQIYHKQSRDSQIYYKEKQTKHQSKVSSQQQYGLQYLSNLGKCITPESPRQSQKSSHLIFQLKQSINNSTSDSGNILPSLEQTKITKLIKQYEKQNLHFENQNSQLQQQIHKKIQCERQLLLRMKKVMKLIQNLKNKQMSKIQNQQKMQKQNESRLSQLQIQSVCSNKNLRNSRQQSQFLQKNKQESHLSTKASFGLTKNLQKQFLPQNRKYPHFNIEENEIQSPKKLRINVVNDTILQYSPIDQSLYSTKKPILYNFNSGETLKDQIFEADNKDKRQSPIKSKSNLVDVSMSGFESRFVPRQSTETRLIQLEDLFQKEIKRCYSPRQHSSKSIAKEIEVEKKQKKQKLKRLSQQIKQLRVIVEKQTSSPNLKMLIFSNSSLT